MEHNERETTKWFSCNYSSTYSIIKLKLFINFTVDGKKGLHFATDKTIYQARQYWNNTGNQISLTICNGRNAAISPGYMWPARHVGHCEIGNGTKTNANIIIKMYETLKWLDVYCNIKRSTAILSVPDSNRFLLYFWRI